MAAGASRNPHGDIAGAGDPKNAHNPAAATVASLLLETIRAALTPLETADAA
jgi:hypothetical protein